MIEIVIQRKGNAYYPFSEEDAEQGNVYPENKPLRAKITGSTKARSYKELCCYMGSCRYIASLELNEDLNTKAKVDYLTRIQAGFVEDTVYDDRTKRVHWIPKSISYDNCNQPTSHRFIDTALERHAELAGIKLEKGDPIEWETASDKYVAFLNTL